MYRTPPRTEVKSRGERAHFRELLKNRVMEDKSEVFSTRTCPNQKLSKEIAGHKMETSSLPPRKEGSVKNEIGERNQAPSKKSSCSSLEARKKQLELEAAEAKAKIEKDLIDIKLAADIAALDAQSSRSSRCSGEQSIAGTSEKVEEWFEKSVLEPMSKMKYQPPPEAPAVPPAINDFNQLSHAIAKLASVTQSANTNFMSRLATSKELPPFSGEPLEWLQFKRSFDESSKLCNYSFSENMARLNRCLRGEAREAVSSLLMSDTTPSTIIEALELRFGRPELIIFKLASQFKRLPPLPQNYHTEIVNFAVKIKNYVAAAQSINQSDYLRSPDLLNSVLSKCPTTLLNKWADYIFENDDYSKPKLQIFSEYLHKEATKIATAGISHIQAQTENKLLKKTEERKPYLHAVLNSEGNNDAKCKFCRTYDHPISSCTKFKRALRKDKWRFVKIRKLCHKCLLSGHGKETCPAAPCDIDECGLPHHRLLHWPHKELSNTYKNPNASPQLTTTTDNEPNHSNSETVTNTVMAARNTGSVMLKVVRVNLHGPGGVISTHALLDDAATVSLVSADLANSINLQGQPETLRMRGAWKSGIVCHSEIVNFKISNTRNQMYEMRARKISEIDLPLQKLSKVNLEDYEHLQNLKNYVPCEDIKPQMLIGQDHFHLIMPLKTIHRNINEPCATLTPLGWCLHGIVPVTSHELLLTTEHVLTTSLYEPRVATSLISGSPSDCIPEETNICAGAHTTPHLPLQQWSDAHYDSEDKQLHELVRHSFALEAIGVSSTPRVNKDENRAIDIVDKSAKLDDGRWEVSLPWKNELEMPDSYSIALKRFLSVERKMNLDNEYASRYRDRINHLFENDYARELTSDEISTTRARVWYLPHFGVDNPNKSKLRLVFDAAATVTGKCLNDFLLQGPDLLQSLLGVLLRFREKPVAIMGDIRDMFLRIRINKDDQHALRFLWRENNNEKIRTYAMTSLIFGANCSPFIAQYIKNKNAARFLREMPEATEAILKSHYMDDYIESVDDCETAIKMIKLVTDIHKQGGFEIRNWTSNKQEVLTNLPQETLSDKVIRIKFACDELPERTLGLLWFNASDSFGFDLSLKRIPTELLQLQRKPTKRELLRIFMSIFDVFGFLAPFTVKAKIILQNTWKNDIKWNDEILEKDNNIFIDWITELKSLRDLRVPRYHFAASHSGETEITSSQSETTLELHIFCDASPAAFAAVAYYRKICLNNQVIVSFIACKSRAAPVNKCITIPKLELQAAVIASRLAATITRENRLIVNKRYFWTDSQIVLHQIKNNTRNYKVFVANRLGEIDELSRAEEWNYVPTKLNIADKATKVNTYKLSNDCEWLRGPHFLHMPRQEWSSLVPESIEEYDDEILQVNITYENNEDLPVPEPTRFSSWLRLHRCTANIYLFIEKCRTSGSAEMTSEMMQRAENLLLRHSQLQTFPEEVHLVKNSKAIPKDSRLRKLTPVWSEDGLLRVGGRITATVNVCSNVKQPIILDGRDYIPRLIVKYYHERTAHSCQETVVNDLRQKYWIVNLRPTVRTIAAKCLFCRIKKANPTNPRMGDLPEGRLAHHQRPFTHCGVDLFGPMEIAVARRRDKRYGVLFTCLTIRAVHIELVPSLSADSFIMALRRMAARRGWPYRMYSDNATNFRGADTELKKSFETIKRSNVKDELLNRGLEWHFISPASPHMGGAWERLVRSVKSALKVILKERAPREEVLITLLAEVENIVNSRPLGHVSANHEYPESLTPNHFLVGSSSNMPIPGKFDNDDFFTKRMWRITERLTDMFWQRWMREVLPTMLPRQKWFQEGPQLKKGDVVVIVDPKLPRNTWPKGRIENVHPGADGRIRIVDVKTRSGLLTRPVTRVALLPTAADDDCPERTMGERM